MAKRSDKKIEGYYSPCAVKVCGLTRQEDVDFCRSLPIDWLGFNFVPWSKRFVSPLEGRRLWLASRSTNSTMPAHGRAIGIVADGTLAEVDAIVSQFPEL